MERYDIYLGLLQSAGSALLGPIFGSVSGLVVLTLIGLWLPVSLAHSAPEGAGEEDAGPSRALWSQLLPMSLAGGAATAVTAWTLSLYISGSFVPGNVILVLACLAGIGMSWRQRVQFSTVLEYPGLWLLASFVALLLGFWHHAASELPIFDDVSRLVFSDLHRDLGAHVQMAGLVRDGGLPMHSFWGALDHDYWALSHTGHLVLMAGFSQLMGVSLYESATLLWIDAIVLIAWVVLGLMAKSSLGVSLRFALVLATLVWGGFAFPEWHRVYDPLRESAGGGFELDAPGLWVSGRSFWNLPQALSVSLSLAGILVLEKFGGARQRGWGGYWVLAASCFLWVAAGWTKPSLVIFIGPALMIWLALNRARASELGCALAVLTAGFLVYAFPALVYALPEPPSWTLAFDAEQARVVLGYLLMAGPGLVILGFGPLFRLVQEKGRGSEFRVLDLAILAAGGSLLFALFFREDQFVGFRVFQPNIWWGISACAVLLVPLLGRSALIDLRQSGWRRLAAGAGLAVASIHTFYGLCLAVAYPTLNLRAHSLSDATALVDARSRTTPGTRFAVDPMLQNYDLLGYLARPAIMPMATGSGLERSLPLSWQNFAEGRGPLPELFSQRLDAVILHRDRRTAAAALRAKNWQAADVGGDFVLWRSE